MSQKQKNTVTTDEGAAGFVFESEKPLSESIVWHWQREFYGRVGITAWQTGVIPSYITSNPFIGKAYAQVVVAFLRDCMAAGQLDPAHPVTIVELAAGSGRFSYYFLRRLSKLMPGLRREGIRVRYVMTDLAPDNIKFWQGHAHLRPFIQDGLLDLAQFDITADQQLHLIESGDILSADTVVNPLIVFANYIFDAVPQDAFLIADGKLSQTVVTTISERSDEPDLNDPSIIQRMKREFKHRPIDANQYADPVWNQILHSYAAQCSNGTFLMPVGALQAVHNLLTMANGRLLLLSSDKGRNHLDEVIDQAEPFTATHGDSISMTVNFHAIGQYVCAHGGFACHPAERDINLKTAAFGLGFSLETLPETSLALQDVLDGFGPRDFYSLQKSMRDREGDEPTISHILALLRLSEWDAGVIFTFGDALTRQMEVASPFLKQEIGRALELVWENYFPIQERNDLALEIGRIYYAMQRPRDSLRYHQISLDMFGEHHVTLYNIGLSYVKLQQLEEALYYFNRALARKPDYSPARSWRIRVQTELGVFEEQSELISEMMLAEMVIE